MNVANLELCKELYAVSGWHDVEQYWEDYPMLDDVVLRKCGLDNVLPKSLPEYIVPAYDLGYLLRKLPPFVQITQLSGGYSPDGWLAEKTNSQQYPGKARASSRYSPEDALCKLAVELIRQNILQPSVTDKESI